MHQSTIIDIRNDGKVWWNDRAQCDMYPWFVSLEDGTVGCANSKTNPPPYQVGDAVFYEITGQTQRGDNKLKINMEDRSGPPQRQAQQPRNADNRGRYQQQPPQRQAPQQQRQAPQGGGQKLSDSAKAYGQKTGNAITNAVNAICAHNASAQGVPDAVLFVPGTPEWAQKLWEVASDIIRVSDFVEASRLAPSASARTGGERGPDAHDHFDETNDPGDGQDPLQQDEPQTDVRREAPRGAPTQSRRPQPPNAEGHAFDPNERTTQKVPF